MREAGLGISVLTNTREIKAWRQRIVHVIHKHCRLCGLNTGRNTWQAPRGCEAVTVGAGGRHRSAQEGSFLLFPEETKAAWVPCVKICLVGLEEGNVVNVREYMQLWQVCHRWHLQGRWGFLLGTCLVSICEFALCLQWERGSWADS